MLLVVPDHRRLRGQAARQSQEVRLGLQVTRDHQQTHEIVRHRIPRSYQETEGEGLEIQAVSHEEQTHRAFESQPRSIEDARQYDLCEGTHGQQQVIRKI